jgi:hypothetical protein
MNGKKAKKIRREFYGDYKENGQGFDPYDRTYYLQPNRVIVCDEHRRGYQKAKKESKNVG